MHSIAFPPIAVIQTKMVSVTNEASEAYFYSKPRFSMLPKAEVTCHVNQIAHSLIYLTEK